MNGLFSDAATRLSKEMAVEGGEVRYADHEYVREGLQAFLLARFPALGADELLDVVDESLERLLRESRRQGPLEYPGAWLFRVASRQAIDRLRRDRGAPLHDADALLEDDQLAALIDRNATRGVIEEGFRRAYRERDHVAVRVVSSWLDLATASGEAPPSRAVADLIGYSHTTVNEALARFRSYIADTLAA